MAKIHIPDELNEALEQYKADSGLKSTGQAASQIIRLFLAGKKPSNPTIASVPTKSSHQSIPDIDESNLSSLSDLL